MLFEFKRPSKSIGALKLRRSGANKIEESYDEQSLHTSPALVKLRRRHDTPKVIITKEKKKKKKTLANKTNKRRPVELGRAEVR